MTLAAQESFAPAYLVCLSYSRWLFFTLLLTIHSQYDSCIRQAGQHIHSQDCRYCSADLGVFAGKIGAGVSRGRSGGGRAAVRITMPSFGMLRMYHRAVGAVTERKEKKREDLSNTAAPVA